MEALSIDIHQVIEEIDWLVWSVAAFSLLLGCWIQTALGFGMAVIAAPIIVLLKPEWVPVVLTTIALVLSMLNTWDQRKYLKPKLLYIPFISRIPGTLAGAWLLTQLNTAWLQFFVAVCVLLAVLISYLGQQFSYSTYRLSLASFASGITGTTTSIGGPPMALVMQHGIPQAIRANLSLYFSYSCTLSLTVYAYLGLLTEQLALISFSLLPVCLVGFIAGAQARPYVDAGRFRPLLLTLCGISGCIALAGAFMKL